MFGGENSGASRGSLAEGNHIAYALFKAVRTVDTVVLGRVANNRVTTARREAVLTVDLVLAAVDTVGASPDVNVRLASLPVRICNNESVFL